MPFEIVKNDIVCIKADAIVNSVNPRVAVGSDVDSEIYRASGPMLIEARKKIGDIPYGHAAETPAFGLRAKYVIHTAAPFKNIGLKDETAVLANCYKNSLDIAKRLGCESIAFPLLGAGNCGFSDSEAIRTATAEISDFVLHNDMTVYLCVYNREAFALSQKLFASVKSYIDEHYISEKCLLRQSKDDEEDFAISYIFSDRQRSCCPACTNSSYTENTLSINSDDELYDIIKNIDAGFSETLLKLIDLSGKKDSEVYKKANIDRKLFSKIRSNSGYKPSKSTAIAFCIALELDIDQTIDLLSRAGYALSHSSIFDLTVEYFIKNKRYNIFELNEMLFALDQPVIGA